MTITTNERGQQNMFAKEPSIYIDPKIQEQMNNNVYETHNERAEKLNGRFAMCGIIAAFVSYALTGKLFFGAW
jgi:hypothetical protein